jgi:hypothetical protein
MMIEQETELKPRLRPSITKHILHSKQLALQPRGRKPVDNGIAGLGGQLTEALDKLIIRKRLATRPLPHTHSASP